MSTKITSQTVIYNNEDSLIPDYAKRLYKAKDGSIGKRTFPVFFIKNKYK